MPVGDPVELYSDPGEGELDLQKIAPFVDALFTPDIRAFLNLGIDFSEIWTSLAAKLQRGSRLETLVDTEALPGIEALDLTTIRQAMARNPDFAPERAWLTTEAELSAIIHSWLVPWFQNGNKEIPDNLCPASDIALIRNLRQHVLRHGLRLWVPEPVFNGFWITWKRQLNGSTRPLRYIRYRLPIDHAYRKIDLLDEENEPDRAGGGVLFELLAAGAHFVIIESSVDLGTALHPTFYSGFNLDYRRAILHSHYTARVASSSNFGRGLIYPAFVTEDTAPARSCPFILSFLFGRTAVSKPNTFFQLEGWPTVGYTGGRRHMADYDLHQETKWNISTYGASIYSEKRGLTVFLAPSEWNPNRILRQRGLDDNPTIMVPYNGASTRQGWLDTNLISN